MTFTFNPSLSDALSKVRQRIGDTDVDKPQIEDETIDAYLGTPWSVLQTAYQCALDLAARYARATEVAVDRQTSNFSTVAKAYRDLANDILAQIARESSGSTAELSGVFVSGVGDNRGAWDVPTLPFCDTPC